MSTPANAVLISGFARIEAASLVGQSVDCIRGQYKQAASIADSARATLNGRSVTGDTIVRAGDQLVFDEPTGTKGY